MSKPLIPLTRRVFIGAIGASATACGLTVNKKGVSEADAKAFHSRWHEAPDRVWIGPEYWANPLQDWALESGRLITTYPRPDSNLHILTHQLMDNNGEFDVTVSLGAYNNKHSGSAGFLIGMLGPLKDYQNNLMARTGGIGAGVNADGHLFIEESKVAFQMPVAGIKLNLNSIKQLEGYTLTLSAFDVSNDALLASVSLDDVAEIQLRGNIALAANFTERNSRKNKNLHNFYNPDVYRYEGNEEKYDPVYGRYWFSDWQISGSKVKYSSEQTFGPILFSQYTLSRGVLKMTAQMPPIGDDDNHIVTLQVLKNKRWIAIASANIDKDAYTARFKIMDWNDTAEISYRLVYLMKNTRGIMQPFYWGGAIQKDPVEKDHLSVADISCNTHQAFPNTQYVNNVSRLSPDLIAFVGDQFYEGSGGYGAETGPMDKTVLDLMRRWYLHGWTWRDITRNVPSVCLPDDHDVLQGNIWGMGGRIGQHASVVSDDVSGYKMPAAWVNIVHRIHTSHHPDAYDATPSVDGISNYYGELLYGRVSFAIIADRMYKSGPAELIDNADGGRVDHMIDPDFEPSTVDVKGAKLLGDRQLLFLEHWASDWRDADMKAVISATIFNAMATTHGQNRERLIADFDTNGWPQSPRDKAVNVIRKAFAFHIAGDQHLPALVQYGIDDYRDASFGFAGPAVNVGYPRWFEPEVEGENPIYPALPFTGDFKDCFGNPMTVVAYANGAIKPRNDNPLVNLQDKVSGIGLVHFNKVSQKINVECWPFLADPTLPDRQFPGWPVTLNMTDNYNLQSAYLLPEILIQGIEKPVLQVVNEERGDIVFTLRLKDTVFQPRVAVEGKYTLIVSEPETGKQKHMSGVNTIQEESELITFSL